MHDVLPDRLVTDRSEAEDLTRRPQSRYHANRLFQGVGLGSGL